MKVLIALDRAPFTACPELATAHALRRRLTRLGHQVELLELPHSPEHGEDRLTWLAVGAIGITNVDRLVTLTFPAHLLEHPGKVMLVHGGSAQRQLADLGVCGRRVIQRKRAPGAAMSLRKAVRAVLK